jgi:hypothetical protein
VLGGCGVLFKGTSHLLHYKPLETMKKETKTEFIILRVTPAQHEKFRQIAQANNTTMSSLIISKVL